MKKTLLYFFLLSASLSIAQTSDWKYFSRAFDIQAFADDGNDLWIGNMAGIVKLDKTTGAKTFYDKSTAPIPYNWVSKIVVDHSGIKWFAMQETGIVSYDGTNWTIYDTAVTGMPYMSVNSLAVDGNNNIWASTSYTSGGLIKYDGTAWTNYNTSNSGIPSNSIGSICTDGDTLWVSTYGGLGKFDGTTWTIYNTSNSTISGETALAMQKDGNGNLWMLHHYDLEKFDGNNFSIFTSPPSLSNYSLTIDTNDLIWTGCTGSPGGVLSFDGTTWTKYDTANSPISDTYATVYADASNNLWMGGSTVDHVDKKSGSAWSTYAISTSPLNNKFVKAVAFDENANAFICTQPSTEGISLANFDWSSWTQLPYYDGYTSLGITANKAGDLFVKNASGIYKYDGSSWATIPGTPALSVSFSAASSAGLKCIASDTLGGIWMDYLSMTTTSFDSISGGWYTTFHEGLAHFDGSAWTTYNHLNSPLPDAQINYIKADHHNNIWISSGGNGLFKFDGTTWTTYNASNSCVPNYNNFPFAIDTANNIWYSDIHFGLIKFDGITCTAYPHPTMSMYSGGATELATDLDGSIWQVTLFDLIHFDGSSWTTFNASNSPIPSANTTSISIDKYGNKWLGTGNGLLVYKEGGVSVVSVPSIAKADAGFSAFPNPFSDAFEIKLDKSYDHLELKMYDLLSREVYHTSKDKVQTIIVPRNSLPAGAYLYQLKAGNKIIANGKIIAK